MSLEDAAAKYRSALARLEEAETERDVARKAYEASGYELDAALRALAAAEMALLEEAK